MIFSLWLLFYFYTQSIKFYSHSNFFKLNNIKKNIFSFNVIKLIIFKEFSKMVILTAKLKKDIRLMNYLILDKLKRGRVTLKKCKIESSNAFISFLKKKYNINGRYKKADKILHELNFIINRASNNPVDYFQVLENSFQIRVSTGKSKRFVDKNNHEYFLEFKPILWFKFRVKCEKKSLKI
jgi:hypothetical protein